MLHGPKRRLNAIFPFGLRMISLLCINSAFPASRQKVEGVGGRKLFACESSEAPPPARIVEGREPQKNVPILLEEKIGRAQNQESGGYFSARLPLER